MTGDAKSPASPAEVAGRLVDGGLTDPEVLEGGLGLKHFAVHGLTPENQVEVLRRVGDLLRK